MAQQQLFGDLLKTQMLMNLSSTSNTASSAFYNFFLFQACEKMVQYIPHTIAYFNSRCCSRRSNIPTLLQTEKSDTVTISCERVFSTGNSKQTTSSHTRMDSVIHYISTIPSIKNLLCLTHHDYVPHDFEPIQLEPDIFFELQDLKHDNGQIETIKFKLFCREHNIQYLQQFIEKCNTEYERRMANKLGTSLYYFDMMTQSKNKRSTQNPLPTSHLMYTRHKFHTTRTFDNVFFEQKNDVKNRVDFFLTRGDWYEKKGIPYTLGFMFHGDPGCGKTSSIKAIANISHRHILNIQLSQIKSKEQLRHLFFNDEVHVYDGMKTEKFIIPVHERLYVIEDIDAMGDAILRREWQKPKAPEKPKADETGDIWMKSHKEEEDSEPLDLSFLLNLLDGTLESSGRILAISSNHPERIDRALIRPGRIDMIVHFKKCNTEILKQMVDSFYDQQFEDWTTEELEYKWSPAEVNQILFRNFKTPEDAIKELKETTPHELYGIQE
jgi:ATPase family associated with various cellular activities (AAA)